MPPSIAEQLPSRAPAVGRVYTSWTTDDLDVAEALTNAGHLQRAADLCWALLGDGRVWAALETRVKGLLGLPLAWDAQGDGRSSGRVIKALEGGDWYNAHSEAALTAIFVWGILLGVGLGQRVWELRGGRWIGVLRPYDARYLRWDAQRRVWTVRTSAGETDIVPGDRRWVLYAPSCSSQADGDERPWMYGAWRRCGRPWLLKYLALGDFGHHSQIHGSAIRTADYDAPSFEGGKPPSLAIRDNLCNALGDVGADTALIPPPGMKFRLVEALAKTWEMFPAQTDLAAREIVIAITGQASSTEIQQGQETGATLHGTVRGDLIRTDGQTGSTFAHDQLLGDYAELNFGNRELAPWPRWKTDPPVNAAQRGAAMTALGQGIAALDAVAPEGKTVDRLALFEQAGIPLVTAPTQIAPPSPTDLADPTTP